MRAYINDNQRIQIVAPSTLSGFCRRLPGVHRVEDGWTCRATPATAYALSSGTDLELSDEIETLAVRWVSQVGPPAFQVEPAVTMLPPWSHQNSAYSFARHKDACLLAMDMGTGKTKVAIDLAINWRAKRILVVCPKSVIRVWFRELGIHIPPEMDTEILLLNKWTAARKAKEVIDFLSPIKAEKARWVVVNYESLRSRPLANLATSRSWDLVILDESHRIKSPTGVTSKIVGKIGEKATRRLCLTGTPMPHSPLDLFGQFRFLDAGVFGTSYGRFRDEFAVTHPRFPSQVRYWRNEEELKRKLWEMAFRVEAADVLDLPEVQHIEIPVTLSRRAQRIYDELESEFIAEVNESRTVTAGHALVRLLRLQQITSGHIKDDHGDIQQIDTAKRDCLKDIMEDIPASEPVVVFCRFRHDLEQIREVARIKRIKYGEISGARKDLTAEGTILEETSLLGVQIASGGLGIDLTRARRAVYYSIGFSLGDYEQSLARVHRPGQEHPVTYYHLVADGTVDRRVVRALIKRRDVVESILEELRE